MFLIELNKQLDKEVYLAFHEAVVGSFDFGKKIKNDHPSINKENHNEYIDNFYLKNKDVLTNTLDETKKCFNEVESVLFSELQKYFNYDYSKENFTCYLSIFDCNPRYIETKTFQVYYKRPYHLRKEVIVHELTHFAFYDFCYGLGIKDSKALWELSEIFNVIFLNLPAIRNIIGAEELLFYPNLKEKLEKVREIWNKNYEPEDFIKEGLKIIALF